MADSSPSNDAALRGFANQIARLKRDLRILETAAQGQYRSVEEGSVDFYDENGVLREQIGKQKDGSYGRKSLAGEIPPAPSEPDVMVLNDGLIAVTWDGRFEERYGGDFRNVQVHLGDTPTFTCTRATQEGAIFARRGGTVLCVTESDDDNPVYVRFVAANNAREESAPSDATLVDETDYDYLEDEVEELEFEANDAYIITAADVIAGVAVMPLSHEPEDESLTATWGTTPQEPTEYTIDYAAKTVTWPLGGFEKSGDRLWAHYAYFGEPEPVNDTGACSFAGVEWAGIELTPATGLWTWRMGVSIDWDPDTALGTEFRTAVVWRMVDDPVGTMNLGSSGSQNAWVNSYSPGDDLFTVSGTHSPLSYGDAQDHVIIGIHVRRIDGTTPGFDNRLPQDSGGVGMLGVTDKSQCLWYFGEQIAVTADTSGIPQGPLTDITGM